MCREMSEESYCVVSYLWHLPLAERISTEEKAGLSFEEGKKILRAENLKRYKAEKASIAVQSGLFLLYPFSSDSSALRISFFSGNPAPSLLRRNSSAGKDAKDE